MLRRNLLLSSLAFCLPSVMAQAKGKRAVVAHWIGKDLGKLCKMLDSSQWPLET